MAIPYLFYKNKSVLPSYGGEQFQNSLYHVSGLPLPYCEKIKTSIRSFSKSFLISDSILLLSLLGIMWRRIHFTSDAIIIATTLYSIVPFRHLCPLPDSCVLRGKRTIEGAGFIVESDSDLTFEYYRYSASGRLKVFSSKKRKHTLTIRLL